MAILDKDEKFQLVFRYFQSDADLTEALVKMKGEPLDKLIAQSKLKILFDSVEVNEILAELDPSNKINEKFDKLWAKTVWEYDRIYKNQRSWDFVRTPIDIALIFRDSEIMRLELRSDIRKLVEEKIK